jgi:predicted HicB family RNase H-like nuclease
MPKKADPNKKQGNVYKSKLLADAKYTGEGLDKYVADGTITEEEYDQAKAKARKSVRLRMPGELKEAIETYVADHADQYKSVNDFICKTLEEKIKQN